MTRTIEYHVCTRVDKGTRNRFEESPISKLCGTEIEPNLDRFHPFGSPVYVLDDKLQAQQSHNKWTDRSRVGIFLSRSPHHSTSVPLVLNSQTGNVSPQFHCIYDDDFATCKRDAKFTSLWQTKAKLQCSSKPTAEVFDVIATQTIKESVGRSLFPEAPSPPADFTVPWEIDTRKDDVYSPASPDPDDLSELSAPTRIPTKTPHNMGVSQAPVRTRAGRLVRPVARYSIAMHATTAFLNTFSPGEDPSLPQRQLQPDIGRYSEPHPLAFVVETLGLVASSDPDTMTLDEALRQPDREQFIARIE